MTEIYNGDDIDRIITEVADQLRIGGLFQLVASLILFGLLGAMIINQPNVVPDPISKFLFIFLLLGLAIFMITLSQNFRRRKRWTFRFVRYLVEGSPLFFPKRLRDGIKDPRVGQLYDAASRTKTPE